MSRSVPFSCARRSPKLLLRKAIKMHEFQFFQISSILGHQIVITCRPIIMVASESIRWASFEPQSRPAQKKKPATCQPQTKKDAKESPLKAKTMTRGVENTSVLQELLIVHELFRLVVDVAAT